MSFSRTQNESSVSNIHLCNDFEIPSAVFKNTKTCTRAQSSREEAASYLVQGPKDIAVRVVQQLLRRREVPGVHAETSHSRGGESPQETVSSAHRLIQT